MNNTLFGEMITVHEMARKIIDECFDEPWIQVKCVSKETDKEVKIKFYQKGQTIKLAKTKGIYVLYRLHGRFLECMYVGEVYGDLNNGIYSRVQHHHKEVDNKSHPAEKHFGGAKARDEYGAKVSDIWYLKVIEQWKIDSIFEKYGVIQEGRMHLDEHIAGILDSLCNTIKRDASDRKVCPPVTLT